MKRCYKCQLDKSIEEFSKNKTRSDGLQASCKTCDSFTNAEYQSSHHSKAVKYRLKAIMILEPVCIECGFTDIRALQIDHINGGGTQERKEEHNYITYKRIASGDTEGYQVLCANCNWIKRSIRGEHAFSSLKQIIEEEP